MITATRDGDEFSIRRSVDALTASRSTPSDHGAIGSESNAVSTATCDGDEVGIRRSIVGCASSTPSNHGASGPTSCQATKRGGVALVERSYTTECVHCSRRE